MTEIDPYGYYAALKARDARFDGRFFVGVSSTRIYCRPICRARLPKQENCTFFSTPAEAEQAGYRPCLLCRPELAPGRSVMDATAVLAHRAARLLEEDCGSGQSLERLAGRLGCTSRHLRRVFSDEYHVSPVQYLQTCRLLMAKSLLTDTDLPISDIAMSAGFGSLRRFNDLFKTHYRLSPSQFRKGIPGREACRSEITLHLGYRPPYRWQELIDFLAMRAIPGVEAVRDGAYLRTVRLVTEGEEDAHGWIRVANDAKRNLLNVTLSSTLLPHVPLVLARIRHLFDLESDPSAIDEVLAPMSNLVPGLPVPGMRVPGCFDAFETTVRAVLGQQVTVKAASTLAARMVSAYGTPLATGIEGLTHAFPTPERILELGSPLSDRLGPLGITAARAGTIQALASSYVHGSIDFSPSAHPETEMEKLLALAGIGPWTAHYLAMRVMGWPDAFLETDHGVKKALSPRTRQEIRELAEAWHPWRSYATINLWNSLAWQDSSLTSH